MMEYGLTIGRRCPSSSTPPPSTCPTRGPSPSSRFLLATRSRYSPGPWRSTTPGSETPSCRTAPLIHTPSVSALPRDGAPSTAGRVLTAVHAGWKCYSGLQRDEKSTQPTPPTGLFHSEHFYLRLNFWLSPFVIAALTQPF